MIVLIIVAVGMLAALWLPQRPVRLALTLVNAAIIVAVFAMLIRRY